MLNYHPTLSEISPALNLFIGAIFLVDLVLTIIRFKAGIPTNKKYISSIQKAYAKDKKRYLIHELLINICMAAILMMLNDGKGWQLPSMTVGAIYCLWMTYYIVLTVLSIVKGQPQ